MGNSQVETPNLGVSIIWMILNFGRLYKLGVSEFWASLQIGYF